MLGKFCLFLSQSNLSTSPFFKFPNCAWEHSPQPQSTWNTRSSGTCPEFSCLSIHFIRVKALPSVGAFTSIEYRTYRAGRSMTMDKSPAASGILSTPESSRFLIKASCRFLMCLTGSFCSDLEVLSFTSAPSLARKRRATFLKKASQCWTRSCSCSFLHAPRLPSRAHRRTSFQCSPNWGGSIMWD